MPVATKGARHSKDAGAFESPRSTEGARDAGGTRAAEGARVAEGAAAVFAMGSAIPSPARPRPMGSRPSPDPVRLNQ